MSGCNKLVRGSTFRGPCPHGPHWHLLTISVTKEGWAIGFDEQLLPYIIEQLGANDTREKLLFMISDLFRGLVQ